MTLALGVTMVGAAFGPIAAAIAFLITYEEYRKHSPVRSWAFKLAIQAALVTLVVFIVLAAGIGLFLEKVVLK